MLSLHLKLKMDDARKCRLNIKSHTSIHLRRVYISMQMTVKLDRQWWWTLVLQEAHLVVERINLYFLTKNMVIIGTIFPCKWILDDLKSKTKTTTNITTTIINVQRDNIRREKTEVIHMDILSLQEIRGHWRVILFQKIKLKQDKLTEMAEKMNYPESLSQENWQMSNLESKVMLHITKRWLKNKRISLCSIKNLESTIRSILEIWVMTMNQAFMTVLLRLDKQLWGHVPLTVAGIKEIILTISFQLVTGELSHNQRFNNRMEKVASQIQELAMIFKDSIMQQINDFRTFLTDQTFLQVEWQVVSQKEKFKSLHQINVPTITKPMQEGKFRQKAQVNWHLKVE